MLSERMDGILSRSMLAGIILNSLLTSWLKKEFKLFKRDTLQIMLTIFGLNKELW